MFSQATELQNTSLSNHDEEALLQQILDFIDAVPSARIKDVHEKFGLQQDTCAKLFHQYLQTNPTIYIRNKRIERAKRLLVETEKSVTEIGNECGVDSSFLSKIFRESVGCNPLDYRRMYYRNQLQNNRE